VLAVTPTAAIACATIAAGLPTSAGSRIVLPALAIRPNSSV
jgi:hypothetical protein